MSEPTWRKLAQVKYNVKEVSGKNATSSAINPKTDEQIGEKRTFPNDGTAEFSFPWGYVGDCEWQVDGSGPHAGTDKGKFHVPKASDIT
jgi:hypothetical protein